MKKKIFTWALVLTGGLLLTAAVGCQRADEQEEAPVSTYEETTPGLYSAPEEEVTAPEAAPEPAPAPSYGVDPAPAPPSAPEAPAAPSYGVPPAQPEAAPPAPSYGAPPAPPSEPEAPAAPEAPRAPATGGYGL